MKYQSFRVIIVALIATASTAWAGNFNTFTFSGDGDKDLYLEPGTEQAIGEARYGNAALNGDWEIGVGMTTQSPPLFEQAQYNWQNGATVPFSFTWDGTTLGFTVDGVMVSYDTFPGGITVDDLFIRAASGDNNAAELTNLAIGGNPLGIDHGAGFASSQREWLVVIGTFQNPFNLTGDVTFTWTDEDGLAGSLPSVQFKLGNYIPEPTSASLLLLASAACLMRRRS